MSKELNRKTTLLVSDPEALKTTADSAVLERNRRLAQATLEATQRYQAIQAVLGNKKGLREFGWVLAGSQRATDGFLAHQARIAQERQTSVPLKPKHGLSSTIGNVLFSQTESVKKPNQPGSAYEDMFQYDGELVRNVIYQIRIMRAVMNGNGQNASIPPTAILELIETSYKHLYPLNPEPDPRLESEDPTVLDEALITRVLQVTNFTERDASSFYALRAQLYAPQAPSNPQVD